MLEETRARKKGTAWFFCYSYIYVAFTFDRFAATGYNGRMSNFLIEEKHEEKILI
jgi:hypothetical protein